MKVNGLSWLPGSNSHIASCGTDGHVFVYNTEKGSDPIQIRGKKTTTHFTYNTLQLNCSQNISICK